jgi:hypothetical protein
MSKVSYVALLIGASLPTSDWWLLSVTPDDPRTVLYIDAGSFVENGVNQLVWLERVYETRSEYGAKRARSRVEVDCKKRLIGAKELRSYDEVGAELPGYTAVIKDPELTPVPSDTIYESVPSFVCDGLRDYDNLPSNISPLSDAAEVFSLMDARASAQK